MKRHGRLWKWLFAQVLALTAVGVADGEDFLYVLATLPGLRSEVHWVPTHAPSSARVLVEDLDQTEFIHSHRDELWWWADERPVIGDLVGQGRESLSEFGDSVVTSIARQGRNALLDDGE